MSSRPPSDLVTVEEAATLARVHIKTVYRWIRLRQIRYYGLPGYYRISINDLLPCVEPCSVAPPQSRVPGRTPAKPRKRTTPPPLTRGITAKRDRSQPKGTS